jgi:hypothetical protein
MADITRTLGNWIHDHLEYNPYNGVWAAKITVNGKDKFLGRFATRVEAAKAYRNAAVEAWGESADYMTDTEIEALDKALTNAGR